MAKIILIHCFIINYRTNMNCCIIVQHFILFIFAEQLFIDYVTI